MLLESIWESAICFVWTILLLLDHSLSKTHFTWSSKPILYPYYILGTYNFSQKILKLKIFSSKENNISLDVTLFFINMLINICLKKLILINALH